MKKILTIGILMGMIFITGKQTMASAGASYTNYMIKQLNTDNSENSPRENTHEITGLEKALRNHR